MWKAKLFVMILPVVFALGATASAQAHQWLKNGAAITEAQLVLGQGLAIIRSGTRRIHCKKSHGNRLVVGDLDIGHFIHYLECTTGQAGCDVHSPGAGNGLILIPRVHSLLVIRKNSKKEEVLADEFKQDETTKEFVTLQFEALPGKSCSEYPETKLTGEVAGIVNNVTESLEFPEPELEGNTLKAFGVAASLVITEKETLVNGGALTAD